MRHLLAAGLANRSSEAPGAVLQEAATAAAVGLQRSQVGLVSAALLYQTLRVSSSPALHPATNLKGAQHLRSLTYAAAAGSALLQL